jgi:hypothetical protein
METGFTGAQMPLTPKAQALHDWKVGVVALVRGSSENPRKTV